MNIFDLEVYEKKKAVPSARHKKNGCKSKQCRLSTDYMTQRQLQKRNGAIVTYQLNKPMDWAEFKAMPVDIQERYLKGLSEKFNVTAKTAGEMFGVTGQSVINLLAKPEYTFKFDGSKRMRPEQKKAYEAFKKGEANVELETDMPAETFAEPYTEKPKTIPAHVEVVKEINFETGDVKTELLHAEQEEVDDFKMNFFSLVFEGKFNRDEFMRSIGVMIPNGANVSIKVKCEFMK